MCVHRTPALAFQISVMAVTLLVVKTFGQDQQIDAVDQWCVRRILGIC